MAPPRSPTWDQQLAVRMRFERGTRTMHPDLERRVISRPRPPAVRYRLRVEVPSYDDREIDMWFSRTTSAPRLRDVYADGPDFSPHRWPRRNDEGDRALCMWHPRDPVERQWSPRLGLLSLITVTRVHLFKEAWWRETGEWLGDEVPHAMNASKPGT